MAADGEDMTNTDASNFVQEVTPFPSAQDLLLLSKQSLPEKVLLQSSLSDANEQKQDEDSTNELMQPVQPLASESPFQPFLQGSLVNEVEVEKDSQRLATVDVGDSGSILPPQHALPEDFNSESAGLGDISEKKVGEKIALFEELAMFEAEVPGARLSTNAMSGSSEVDGLILEEELTAGESAVFSGEDVLFEGLSLVDPPSEAPANGTVNLGLDDVSMVEGVAEVIGESVGEKVEVESVTSLNDTSKKSEASQGSHADITLSNGTHKAETLGELLSRDHKEKVSREVGKGTGQETGISSKHAPIILDSIMSKGYQGSVLNPAPVVNMDGYVVFLMMEFLVLPSRSC